MGARSRGPCASVVFSGDGKRNSIIPRANDHGNPQPDASRPALGARFMIWKIDKGLKRFNALTNRPERSFRLAALHTLSLSPPKWVREEDEIDCAHQMGQTARRTR